MKYFTIEELCKSSTATNLKIDNTPDETIKKHLQELVENLLDPLREEWSKYCQKKNLGTGGLKVSSGYRCLKLNTAVGGVKTSAHMVGYAADITPCNKKMDEFEKWISTVFAKSGKYKFDQIILEKSKTSKWVHIGIKNQLGKQRKQCFKLSV